MALILAMRLGKDCYLESPIGVDFNTGERLTLNQGKGAIQRGFHLPGTVHLPRSNLYEPYSVAIRGEFP